MEQGSDVGRARGRIEIDTSQVERVPSIMQGVSQTAAKSMGAIDAAITKNQKNFVAAASAAQNFGTVMSGSLAAARQAVQAFAAAATGSLAQARAAMQSTVTSSQSLTAALAAAAKASNTRYMIANAPAPVFAKQGGGGFGGVANALGFGGGLGSVAGGLGIAGGAAGIAQMGRAVLAAEALATAYDRQGIAAANLAGSQGRLNALLEVYDEATGGIVSKADALGNVTKLMAVGFADNAAELDKFATAIRGISIAMGASQDTVTQNLILELFTQRGMRLDQLGLQYDKVKARADELQAADASLTSQMAYQNAVLEQAIERFGGLAESAVGAATGMEKTATAWKNLFLEIGQASQGPLDVFGAGLAAFIDGQADRLRRWMNELDAYIKLLRMMGMAGPWLTSGERAFVSSSGARNAQRYAQRGAGSGVTPIIEGEREAKLNWAQGKSDLDERTNQEILEQGRDYNRQRQDTESAYQKTVSREAEDFARHRRRQEQDLVDSIADIHEDAARREQRMAEDLARTITRAQEDSAERIAGFTGDHNKRIAELDEDFQKDQKRREEKYRDDILSAAGRLDAIKILELRKDQARELKDRKEAHKDHKKDLQEQLAARIADENKSLATSIAQAKEAHERQLTDARENDARRIEDMKADYAKSRAQEDIERGIRLQRQAEDHAAQLVEMARAHQERKAQIARHAREERTALDEEHDKEMIRIGAADEATRKRQEAKEKALEALWDKFHAHITGTLTAGGGGAGGGRPTVPGMAIPGAFASGGLVRHSGWARVHRGEFVMPAPAMAAASGMGGNSRSLSFGDITITIAGTTNMGRGELREAVVEALEEIAGGQG